MLDVINRLLHGYVALPVIRACDQSSLFDLLSQDTPISFDKINNELGANSGHLKASLRLLESLGWLDRTERGAYLLTSLVNRRETIHPNVLELYQQPLQDLSAWLSSPLWNAFTESLMQQDPLTSNETQDHWHDYLHGPYLVPLLILLQQQGAFDDLTSPLFTALPEQDRSSIQTVFAYKGWCHSHNNF